MKRKIVHWCMLFVCVAFSMAVHAQETSIHVSPTGSDSASGTVDAPFATLRLYASAAAGSAGCCAATAATQRKI